MSKTIVKHSPIIRTGVVSFSSLAAVSGQEKTITVSMPSANYVPLVSFFNGSSFWAALSLRIINKNADSFQISIWNDSTNPVTEVDVLWIAIAL